MSRPIDLTGLVLARSQAKVRANRFRFGEARGDINRRTECQSGDRAVEGFDADRSSKNPAFVQSVADKNVVLTLAPVRERSPILRDMADSGAIGLAGAMYDVHTGRVDFV